VAALAIDKVRFGPTSGGLALSLGLRKPKSKKNIKTTKCVVVA